MADDSIIPKPPEPIVVELQKLNASLVVIIDLLTQLTRHQRGQ
jgi:hypothetical protein